MIDLLKSSRIKILYGAAFVSCSLLFKADWASLKLSMRSMASVAKRAWSTEKACSSILECRRWITLLKGLLLTLQCVSVKLGHNNIT